MVLSKVIMGLALMGLQLQVAQGVEPVANVTMVGDNMVVTGIAKAYPACNARYNTPCTLTNVYRMVNKVRDALDASTNVTEVLQQVDDEYFNVPGSFGFHPFVLEAENLTFVARGDGGDKSVSLDEEAKATVHIHQFDLTERMREAPTTNDGWFAYLAKTEGTVKTKVAYGQFARNGTYFIMASFINQQLPLKPWCSGVKSLLCSISNTRSNVGALTTKLLLTTTKREFQQIAAEVSYTTTWNVGSQYSFLAGDGYGVFEQLYAHPIFNKLPPAWVTDELGFTVTDIVSVAKVGAFITGEQLYKILMVDSALSGGAWATYQWPAPGTNTNDGITAPKISFCRGLYKYGYQLLVGQGFTHIREDVVSGENCGTCTSTNAHPCSISNALAVVGYATVDLLTNLTVQEAIERFEGNDEFVMSGGFTTFLYDSTTGVCMAHALGDNNQVESRKGYTWAEYLANIGNTVMDGDEIHAKYLQVATFGSGWLRYEWRDSADGPVTYKVAFISKTANDQGDMYIGVEFDHIPSKPMTSFNKQCSSKYGGVCEENTVTSLVGYAATSILTSTNISSLFTDAEMLGPGNTAGDFDLVVLDRDSKIHYMSNDKENVGMEYLPYLMQEVGITTVAADFFEKKLRGAGEKHSGGWAKEEEWHLKDGSIEDGSWNAYVLAVEYEDPSSGQPPQVFYVLASYLDNPKPPLCGNCPENSFCGEDGFCECGQYFLPVFSNTSEIGCSTGGFAKEYTMECVFNEEKDDILTIKTLCYAMFSVNCIIVSISLTWIVVFRKHKIVRSSQRQFLALICVGTIVSSSSMLFFVTDDYDGPRAGLTGLNAIANNACMLQAWSYCLGFVLTFSSLFVKLYRVNKIFNNSAFSRKIARIQNSDLIKAILIALSVDAIILTLWSINEPLKYVQKVDATGMLQHGNCSGESAGTYIKLIAIYHVLLLLGGNYLAYKARGIDEQFSESKYVQLAMISNLQIFALAIPVLVMVSSDAQSNMFIRSGVVFLNDLSVQFLIFAPKMWLHATGQVKDTKTITSGAVSPSSAAPTATDFVKSSKVSSSVAEQ